MVLLIYLLSATDCKNIHYKVSENYRKMLIWQQSYFSPANKERLQPTRKD